LVFFFYFVKTHYYIARYSEHSSIATSAVSGVAAYSFSSQYVKPTVTASFLPYFSVVLRGQKFAVLRWWQCLWILPQNILISASNMSYFRF